MTWLHELPSRIDVEGAYLEHLVADDQDDVVDLQLANIDSLVPEGLVTQGDERVELEQTFAETLESMSEGRESAYAVRSVEGKIIGAAGVELPHAGSLPVLNVWLDEAYRGQGIGTRTADALARSIFRVVLVPAINLQIRIGNRPAEVAAQKLGAVLEPENVPPGMQELDVDIWRLYRDR